MASTKRTARNTLASPAATTDCCSSVGSDSFDGDAAAELSAGFAALADPVRLHLLSLIAAQPDDGVCVCDLVGPVGRSQPTVSHHLKVLREAGLVVSEKRGTWAWYRAVPERIAALRRSLG